MYQANTIIFSSSGKSVVEIKRDNRDGTYATVMYIVDPNGMLNFKCAEYNTLEGKITLILNDNLTKSN